MVCFVVFALVAVVVVIVLGFVVDSEFCPYFLIVLGVAVVAWRQWRGGWETMK